MRTDRQTDRHGETVTFRNFANAPRNTYMCVCWMALFPTLEAAIINF